MNERNEIITKHLQTNSHLAKFKGPYDYYHDIQYVILETKQGYEDEDDGFAEEKELLTFFVVNTAGIKYLITYENKENGVIYHILLKDNNELNILSDNQYKSELSLDDFVSWVKQLKII